MSQELFARQRIRGNPLQSVLERYIEYLTDRGYAPSTWCRYVTIVDHFGRWLKGRALSRQAMRQFIVRHLPTCRCRMPGNRDPIRNAVAFNRLVEMMGNDLSSPAPARGFVKRLIRRYQDYLVEVRGLKTHVAASRALIAERMLVRMKVHRRLHLAKWEPEQVQRHVFQAAKGYAPASIQCIASGIRVFLRFLLCENLIPRDLAGAVPTLPTQRTRLPQTLGAEEVERLIDAVDLRTPLGLRNRAIVLCMSELGLRASEVAGLDLSGVDLGAGVLRFRRVKERESAAIPMTRRLAKALDAYLRCGPPRQEGSSPVFVRHCAPTGKRLTVPAILMMVQSLTSRAGMRNRFAGAHALRHSFAKRMLTAGASLKQIADLLGHQSINTTTIYAKVDMATLSRVALPWPTAREVRP
ncbi:MAG: tyrosine-type recombinase/integrase [Planctomycetes bacterium]|nr:tyrosine-type recombinase/integrase [Planctomycetota bacterium]